MGRRDRYNSSGTVIGSEEYESNNQHIKTYICDSISGVKYEIDNCSYNITNLSITKDDETGTYLLVIFHD